MGTSSNIFSGAFFRSFFAEFFRPDRNNGKYLFYLGSNGKEVPPAIVAPM